MFPRRLVHAVRRAALPQGVQLPVQPAEQQLRGVARAGDQGRRRQGAPVAGLRGEGLPVRCRRHGEEELDLGHEVDRYVDTLFYKIRNLSSGH